MTAHDCTFTLDAIFNEAGLSRVRSAVIGMVAGYRAIDDDTLEVMATQAVAPNVFFLNSVGAFPILPRHVWEGVAFDDWGSVLAALGDDPAQVVGNGPFRFGSWERGEGITLVRNDQYWPPERSLRTCFRRGDPP